MFHRFCPAARTLRPQGALTPDEFDAVLRQVGLQHILPASEWLARVDAGTLRDRDRCVTFDDGLRSQVEHALPVLRRHGLEAFWFVHSCAAEGRPPKAEVYSHLGGIVGMEKVIGLLLSRCPPDMLQALGTVPFADYSTKMRAAAPFYTEGDLQYRFLRNCPEYRERFETIMDGVAGELGYDLNSLASELWLGDADLRALAESGQVVGLHSYSHPYELAALPPDAQREEYRRNYDHLQRATGRRPVSMSHPLNSYGEETLRVLEQLGIRCGFRANMAPSASGRVNPTRLELAREDSANLLRQVRPPIH
jgi:peptidoglycan/xylan/chitin deacetylase (PgdA/CDA1 family)